MYGILLPATLLPRGHEVPETGDYSPWVHVQMRGHSAETQAPQTLSPPLRLRLRLKMQPHLCTHSATLQIVREGRPLEPVYLYQGSHPSVAHHPPAFSEIALQATDVGFFQHAGTETWGALANVQGQLTYGGWRLGMRQGERVYQKPFKTREEDSHGRDEVQAQPNGQLSINDLPPGARPLYAYAALLPANGSLLEAEQYYCTLSGMGGERTSLEMIAASDLQGMGSRASLALQDPPSPLEKITLLAALGAGEVAVSLVDRHDPSTPPLMYTSIEAIALGAQSTLIEVIFQRVFPK